MWTSVWLVYSMRLALCAFRLVRHFKSVLASGFQPQQPSDDFAGPTRVRPCLHPTQALWRGGRPVPTTTTSPYCCCRLSRKWRVLDLPICLDFFGEISKAQSKDFEKEYDLPRQECRDGVDQFQSEMTPTQTYSKPECESPKRAFAETPTAGKRKRTARLEYTEQKEPHDKEIKQTSTQIPGAGTLRMRCNDDKQTRTQRAHRWSLVHQYPQAHLSG